MLKISFQLIIELSSYVQGGLYHSKKGFLEIALLKLFRYNLFFGFTAFIPSLPTPLSLESHLDSCSYKYPKLITTSGIYAKFLFWTYSSVLGVQYLYGEMYFLVSPFTALKAIEAYLRTPPYREIGVKKGTSV